MKIVLTSRTFWDLRSTLEEHCLRLCFLHILLCIFLLKYLFCNQCKCRYCDLEDQICLYPRTKVYIPAQICPCSSTIVPVSAQLSTYQHRYVHIPAQICLYPSTNMSISQQKYLPSSKQIRPYPKTNMYLFQNKYVSFPSHTSLSQNK